MIIVDVETTGLYKEIHSIASIGAVDFSNSENLFYKECRIWEGAQISKQALEINGFSEGDLRDSKKPSLEQAIIDFLKWTEIIKDKTLAGENPSFDGDFLRNSAERYKIKWPFGHRKVDLHSLSYAHHIEIKEPIPLTGNRSNINLDTTLNYVGLPSEPKPHNALMGAKMEAEAFSRIMLGKSFFNDFKEYFIPNYLILTHSQQLKSRY